MKESGNEMISGIIFQNRTSPGGGFNPIKKIWVKMGIIPNFRGENEKFSKRPPRSIYRYKCHYFFKPWLELLFYFGNSSLWDFQSVSSLAHQRPLSLVLRLSLGNTLPMRNSQYPEISLQMLPFFTRIRKEDFCTKLKVKTMRKIWDKPNQKTCGLTQP